MENNKDNAMTLSKDTNINTTNTATTKLNVSLQMETQTVIDDTLLAPGTDSSPLDNNIDVSKEITKDEVTSDAENATTAVAPTGKGSIKKSKKLLYMGRSAGNDEYVCSITKLEREIRKLRLENAKLKLINMKEMESLNNKRDKAITKPSEDKLHNDNDEASADAPIVAVVKEAN